MITPQKKKFIAAILGGANQTQAAIIAGYSEDSAKQTGYRLSRDPEIQAALQKKWLKVDLPKNKGDFSSKSNHESGENDEYSPDLYKKYDDPIDFLKAAMNNTALDMDTRKDAAKALLPYIHSKKGEGGKKDAKSDAAKRAADRFVKSQPPRLAVNNG